MQLTRDEIDAIEQAGYENVFCPAPESHYQNAYDQLFPVFADRPDVLSRDQMEQVDALADAEYRACEGH